jgi:hypothetical protein
MTIVMLDGYTFKKSTRKGKKLQVLYNGIWIHFGESGAQHFKDTTGLYSELDHNDPTRRTSYIKQLNSKMGHLPTKIKSSQRTGV